jgi:hypothetical protein
MKSWRFGFAFVLTLIIAAIALADGCILSKLGVYVRETEQRAFIEWSAGQERLYIATRSEASSEPTLWIIPVPADPKRVKAEPVERFPRVVYERDVVQQARVMVEETVSVAMFLDTGIPCLFGFALGSKASALPDGMEVHNRVEKLGMIVEVLSAKSVKALDRYLRTRELNIQAAGIGALAPYLQKEYTLICGWTAEPGRELPARALRIDFPTPQVFYPLLPTRIYESPVNTAVYVRGWFQPPAATAFGGFRCKHVWGRVSEEELGSALVDSLGVEEAWRRDWRLASQAVDPALEERLTRVELDPSPRNWTEDLLLEAGAPAAVTVAEGIYVRGRRALWGLLVLLGVLIAGFLPLLVIPAEKRKAIDFLWSIAVGAAIALTIFASMLVFSAWIHFRKAQVEPHRLSTLNKFSLVAAGLSIAAVGIAALLMAMNPMPNPVLEAIVPLLLIPAFGVLLVALPLSAIAFIFIAGRKAIWLVLFAFVHLAVACASSTALASWIGRYE